MYPKCPHCSGVLYPDTDGYEKYLNCMACARQFHFDMTSRRMTLSELNSRYKIHLTGNEKRGSIEVEQ